MIDFSFDLFKKKPVIGVDEVGRGAWAGPVFAGAAFLKYKNILEIPRSINDSKKLSEFYRLEVLKKIRDFATLSVGSVCAKCIDKIGIQNSVVKAMEMAIINLKVSNYLEDYIIVVDGNYLPIFKDKKLNIKFLKKGDTISPSVAVASIFAKVKRDDFMKNLHNSYPEYKWERNMGYGTKDHRMAIDKLGPTQEHRMSFKPLKN